MVKSTSRQPHETSTTNANNKPYPLSLTSFGDCLTGISKKRRKQKNQLLEKVKSALILLTNEIDYLTPHFSPDPLVVSDDHDNDTNNNNDNNNPTTISTAPTTNNINDNHMLINYHQPYLLLTSDSNSLPTIHQKTTRDLEDELLKQEEYLLRERSEMVKRGQWSIVPMKKSEEPARNKTNWDYLLKEMEWLAKDFADERRHKMKVAKQCANGAVKHHKATVSKEQKKKKDEEQQIRKLASNIAKLVKKDFWSKLEKIVSIRNQTKIDIKRQQYLQKKQNMLVEKSERLSQFLSQDLVTPSTPLTPMFNQQQPQEHEFSDYNNVTEEQKSNLDQMMIDGDETSIVIPKASDVEHYEPSVDSHSHMLLMRDEDDKVEGSTMNDVDEDDEEFILETNHALKSSTQEKSDAGVEEAVNGEDLDHEEQEDDDDRISSSDEEAEEEMADYSDEIAELQKDQHVPLTEIIQNYSHDDESEERRRIQMASQSAQQFQPTGFTLSTSTVRTKVPDLLNPEFTLREYQHIGLDWLVAMHDRGLNGILADEMGLGKTFMTIATLAYLASEKHIWGPHLVVAPASVLLNWEIEFKRFCPSFKILAYYGSQKQRKEKRIGWNKPDTFHVCITSYNLVVQDKNIFKRKKWHYLILDEAHHIKNFKSQCWQTLLNFNTSHRILLTGTPLQNNVMELWSLMHFLMPQVFQSHSEFKEWFANPVSSMVEGNQEMNEQNRRIIARLHSILRPFILRRLKADVAKQLPKKHEHVVQCNLSKRQRFLYEDFMARSDTRTNLISGNFFKIINVMMQLRKVCNHPDLFETRPIISPFESSRLKLRVPSLVTNMHYSHPLTSDSCGNYANRGSARVDTSLLGLELSTCLPSTFEVESLRVLQEPLSSFESISDLGNILTTVDQSKKPAIFLQYQKRLEEIRTNERKHKYSHLKYLNDFRCQPHSIYYRNTLEAAHVTTKDQSLFFNPNIRNSDTYCSLLHAAVKTPEQRILELDFEIENFVCIIPKTRVEPVELLNYCENPIVKTEREYKYFAAAEAIRPKFDIFNRIQARTQVYFPDKRLLQYDCGKLQVLARLLRKLQSGNHRVLIFTQMSSMLNILEAFLSMHSYSYFRLDGSTKIEQRQYLMDRFNNDPKIFAFILSTRSGGLGINLTGADTVVFYDSDWNPAMDAQAQDRCHRIGQTREVNIYRLISESTIEERILLKANQKRQMNDMVIHEGGFTPDLLKKMDVTDFFDSETLGIEPARQSEVNEEVGNELTQKDVERALASAEDEDDVIAYRNARKEENEMFKLDFEEEFDQDLEQNLRNIEKFGVRYLEMRSQGVLEQEMANLEEQHRLSEESWKNDMDDIEQRVEEESNRRAFAQEEFDENIIEVFPDVEQEDFLKAFQVFLPELECHDLYKELLKPTPEEERLIREAEDLYTFGPYKVSPLPEVELVPEVVVASNDALAETIQDSSTSRTTPATSAPVVAPKQKSTEKDLTKTNKKKKRRRSESGVDESATTEASATVTPATKKMKLEDKKKDKKKKGTTVDELEQSKKEEKSGEKKTKKDKKTKKEKSKEETPSKVSTKKDKEKEKETKKSSKKKLEESTKEKKSEKKTDKSEKASSEKTDKSDKKIDKKERKKDKKKTAGETETKSSSKTAAIAAKNETTESSASAIKDTPWKTFEDQALLQSVHLVKQESLEELNWNVIKDTYATLVYPIVSARAIEQMQQRYAIVSKKEASSSSSTQKSLTQSIFDARKQNFTKYWNLWVKSKTSSSGATKKKSTTEKISKKKKKAQKNPLMPSGVSEYFSPLHYTQLYAEILSSAQNAQKVNATRLPKTPANAATTFTTNGMSGPTLASSLKTPANNTHPGPSAPNTGARKTTIIKKNSITPMPPTNNPSSSQAVPLQINNNQPPMMTNPLPAHNHPQTFTTYSNLIPGTFPMQQPLTANQFGRVNNSGLQMGFMSSNPLFPGGINMGNMPMTRPIPSNNIPNQPQFPAGVFSNLVAAQPTPVQQSSQAISSDKMARFLLQKFPNSRAEVSTVMAQTINDNQKSQLLMQIHQRYATPTLPQHVVQPAPPTVSAPPTGGVFTGLLAQGPSPQPTSTTPTSNTQPPPQQ